LGLQVVGANYFLSIGRAFPAFFLGLSRQFLILMPLVILLPRFFGLEGVWYGIPLADLLSTVITMVWFLLSWRGIKKNDPGKGKASLAENSFGS
jgi:Na+-driven multidrug efflux pump